LLYWWSKAAILTVENPLVSVAFSRNRIKSWYQLGRELVLKTGWFHSDLMPTMTSHLVDRMVSLISKKKSSAVGFLHHQIS